MIHGPKFGRVLVVHFDSKNNSLIHYSRIVGKSRLQITDQWEYPTNMEKKGTILYYSPFPNSLIRLKNGFVKNGTAIRSEYSN